MPATYNNTLTERDAMVGLEVGLCVPPLPKTVVGSELGLPIEGLPVETSKAKAEVGGDVKSVKSTKDLSLLWTWVFERVRLSSIFDV